MTEKPSFFGKTRFLCTVHSHVPRNHQGKSSWGSSSGIKKQRSANCQFAGWDHRVTVLVSKNDPDKIGIQSNFPNLFGDTSWGTVTCRFERLNEMPPLSLISNVNLVPFNEDRWLLLRLQTGEWEVPGGTLEPGESYSEAIGRELIEEAGARLKTFEPFGAWHCFSTASKPYRPHLPHPEFYRLVGYGAVEIIGNPENPEGGEQVASVEFVPIEEAIQRFRDINRFELAELYQLAARMREAKNENLREIGV